MQNFPMLCRIYLFTDNWGCGSKTRVSGGVKISQPGCQGLEKSQVFKRNENFKTHLPAVRSNGEVVDLSLNCNHMCQTATDKNKLLEFGMG